MYERIPMLMVAVVLNAVFIFLLLKLLSDWLKIRYKNKMFNQLMQKFSSSEELSQFLGTEDKSRFISSLPSTEASTKEKILSSFGRGIIIAFLGIACFAAGLVYQEFLKEFLIAGILVSAVGIGFLVSTFLSYRLSKKWNLFSKD